MELGVKGGFASPEWGPGRGERTWPGSWRGTSLSPAGSPGGSCVQPGSVRGMSVEFGKRGGRASSTCREGAREQGTSHAGAAQGSVESPRWHQPRRLFQPQPPGGSLSCCQCSGGRGRFLGDTDPLELPVTSGLRCHQLAPGPAPQGHGAWGSSAHSFLEITRRLSGGLGCGGACGEGAVKRQRTQFPHLQNEVGSVAAGGGPSACHGGEASFPGGGGAGRRGCGMNELHSPGTEPAPWLPPCSWATRPVRATGCQAPRAPSVGPGHGGRLAVPRWVGQSVA